MAFLGRDWTTTVVLFSRVYCSIQNRHKYAIGSKKTERLEGRYAELQALALLRQYRQLGRRHPRREAPASDFPHFSRAAG
jgi:hypothetical protein